MKSYIAIILLFIFLITTGLIKKSVPKVLIFCKTAGFHHSSIPSGIDAIEKLGGEYGFETDTTTDATLFYPSNLKKYAAIIFLNTTGTLFNEDQEKAFKAYIESGGGFMGIHAATDAEYQWPWYGQLAGAWFVSHPAQQQATLHVVDTVSDATKHLPREWTRFDEWYNFKNISSDIHVLITIDESSYKGGINGSFHPMAWYHKFDGGRAFYTELGHTEQSYSDPLYLRHILGGIRYAIGESEIKN